MAVVEDLERVRVLALDERHQVLVGKALQLADVQIRSMTPYYAIRHEVDQSSSARWQWTWGSWQLAVGSWQASGSRFAFLTCSRGGPRQLLPTAQCQPPTGSATDPYRATSRIGPPERTVGPRGLARSTHDRSSPKEGHE